ncbi:type III secretion system ATPase HrcN [Pseudomonas syringae]|uniref:protein-secreting ATPase n=1 Tax=Pseudomonas syringae TaxID=317 RepID=A0A9Q4A4W9_PSESX|nr:type III secretion system ATPase HrcN [Pseudomonas syringae]KTB84931.1 ATP synthase [Pseudomonas syringae pv. syringae PD2766]MCF5467655.1 FliI/YscN family ATPase [Pseudomonas syringae]MCF5474615.1 FliI/YscN family ATPase [Pseudomonas syringae]MCF5484133.1 FliI/YscN family ATPase [Pseudomonas syringae]MCF5487908.1 FliI/YscN family ATPase [Pseudomonas syringae]
MNAALSQWQERQGTRLSRYSAVRVSGRVSAVRGILLECKIPSAKVGDLCEVSKADGSFLLAEIVGFTQECTLLSALGAPDGIQVGAPIRPLGIAHRIGVDDSLLGCVLDGFGRPLMGDCLGAFAGPNDRRTTLPVIADALPPTQRPRITRALPTGIRAIDSAILLGEGQRVGLFAGAGCGKTTLMAELARNMDCDVIVFGLIGERGRELREFLDHELDETLRSRSVLVCATSDRSSMERARAAFTATAIAEAFRARGQKVLLLLDSLTRFARAQREIGIASGEPLGRGGLPPSVYTLLPRLVERAGMSENGSITALYTVLIEQDSMNDPVADEVRSLLDGHIVLSRKLAERGHYPAIDVSASISRILSNVTGREHQRANNRLRQLLAAYKQVEMLLRLGEYQAGADPVTDCAVQLNDAINTFLRQDLREPVPLQETLDRLLRLTSQLPE